MSGLIRVWGAGGHGKVVADLALSCGFDVEGFIDDDPGRADALVGSTGLRVLGDGVMAIREAAAGGRQYALGVGDNRARRHVLERLRPLALPVLVDPSAQVSRWARLGAGSVALAGAVVNADAVVAQGVIINTAAIVEHDCVLGDGCHISSGAVLAGGVEVGALAWVGAGACVIPGIRIGAGAIVGAGATIIRDVPAGVTVVGTPGRIVKESLAHP